MGRGNGVKILTDEEIKNVFLETFVDDSALTEAEWTAARAIEAAILERIGEPVAWMSIDGAGVFKRKYSDDYGDIPLFAIKGVE